MTIIYIISYDAYRASPPPSAIFVYLLVWMHFCPWPRTIFINAHTERFAVCVFRFIRFPVLTPPPTPYPVNRTRNGIGKQAGRASIIIIASQCIFNCIHFLVQIDLDIWYNMHVTWGELLKFFIRPPIQNANQQLLYYVGI